MFDPDLMVFTEARARDLRLSYSRYLAPRRLLTRVLEVEQRAAQTLTREGRMVACFGQEFAGYLDSSCAVCQLQAACLVRSTARTLPAAEAELGADATVMALAEHMALPLGAVTLMRALRASVMVQDHAAYTDEPLLRYGHGRRPVPDLTALRRPPTRRISLPAIACLFAAQAAETAWPPKPRGAHLRLGTGLAHNFVVQALAYTPPRLTYGSPSWRRRVARDRRRLPELDWLPDGTVLRVVRQRELVEIAVHADRLVWRGESYPTLYEIVAAVAGRHEYKQSPQQAAKSGGTRLMPKRSARRFFAPAFAAINALAEAQRAQTKQEAPHGEQAI